MKRHNMAWIIGAVVVVHSMQPLVVDAGRFETDTCCAATAECPQGMECSEPDNYPCSPESPGYCRIPPPEASS
jgi:hypothetical protein